MAGLAVEKIDDYRYRIPKQGAMRVPGIVYADARLFEKLRGDQALDQVRNVACLPGIVGASLAMPDIHWGYGFPIGGVAAFDADDGVVSPGGVGYDINCGVRLIRSSLRRDQVASQMRSLVKALFASIPAGVGGTRADLRLSVAEEKKVLLEGAAYAVARGYGRADDLERIEEGGRLAGADPEQVSDRALERGASQLGTLGSGNHFVEVGYVAEIYDEEAARAFDLFRDQITVIVHTGSRGFGYQVCDEHLARMVKASAKYGITLPDRQLCCAPIRSPEAEAYLGAMRCAVNYAFANRQVVTHFVREAFERALGIPPEESRLDLVYDVCHNIAKPETHRVGGDLRRLFVHRKGATRAFGPGHPLVPERYRAVGQPVLIPGDMGRHSFVLAGTEKAMLETFGSTCHGAGRVLSRTAAMRAARGRTIQNELRDQGVFVMAEKAGTLAEEMPEAYKDVADVVDVVHRAGISRKVARLRPLGVIKG
ncbi:MAG: RtcB family protein [Planctomycetes bacterium]|nr:RtcB family protein [Planctomycetota bacterium]MBI3845798.1 RtcB family protein [Planctomycetota bacterium]